MDRPSNPGCRAAPCRRARRGTRRAVRAPATAAAGTAGRCWTWRWPAARRRSARTAVGRVVLGVFGSGSRLETAEIGRAHVGTPVTNAHVVCRLLLEEQKKNSQTL